MHNQTRTRNSWFQFLNHPEELHFPTAGDEIDDDNDDDDDDDNHTPDER